MLEIFVLKIVGKETNNRQIYCVMNKKKKKKNDEERKLGKANSKQVLLIKRNILLPR